MPPKKKQKKQEQVTLGKFGFKRIIKKTDKAGKVTTFEAKIETPPKPIPQGKDYSLICAGCGKAGFFKASDLSGHELTCRLAHNLRCEREKKEVAANRAKSSVVFKKGPSDSNARKRNTQEVRRDTEKHADTQPPTTNAIVIDDDNNEDDDGGGKPPAKKDGDDWLMRDDNFDKWEAGMSAGERRVLMSHFVAAANQEVLEMDDARVSCFRRCGVLLTLDGTDDECIKPQGCTQLPVVIPETVDLTGVEFGAPEEVLQPDFWEKGLQSDDMEIHPAEEPVEAAGA